MRTQRYAKGRARKAAAKEVHTRILATATCSAQSHRVVATRACPLARQYLSSVQVACKIARRPNFGFGSIWHLGAVQASSSSLTMRALCYLQRLARLSPAPPPLPASRAALRGHIYSPSPRGAARRGWAAAWLARHVGAMATPPTGLEWQHSPLPGAEEEAAAAAREPWFVSDKENVDPRAAWRAGGDGGAPPGGNGGARARACAFKARRGGSALRGASERSADTRDAGAPVQVLELTPGCLSLPPRRCSPLCGPRGRARRPKRRAKRGVAFFGRRRRSPALAHLAGAGWKTPSDKDALRRLAPPPGAGRGVARSQGGAPQTQTTFEVRVKN